MSFQSVNFQFSMLYSETYFSSSYMTPDNEVYDVECAMFHRDMIVYLKWEHKKTALAVVEVQKTDDHISGYRGATVVEGNGICLNLCNEINLTENLEYVCRISILKYEQHKPSCSLDDEETVERQTKDYMLTKLSVDLCSLLHRGDMTDAVLTNGSLSIRVHKAILSARSSKFHREFLTNPTQIYIEDISNKALENLAIFIYSGAAKISDNLITPELYEAAYKYNIKGLRDLCSAHLSNLTLKNVTEILALANKYGDTALKNRALYFIKRNTDEAVIVMLLRDREIESAVENFEGENPTVEDFMLALSGDRLAVSD